VTVKGTGPKLVSGSEHVTRSPPEGTQGDGRRRTGPTRQARVQMSRTGENTSLLSLLARRASGRKPSVPYNVKAAPPASRSSPREHRDSRLLSRQSSSRSTRGPTDRHGCARDPNPGETG
jgi:hypothetical protein